MRPSALTGSKVGSDDEAGAAVPLARQRGVDELELPGHGSRELHARTRGFRGFHPFAQRPCAGQVEIERFGNGDAQRADSVERQGREFGIDGGQFCAAPASS